MEFWTGAEQLPFYSFIIRAVIVYVYILIIIKVAGQRTLGDIDALDFIFGIVIGDVLGSALSQSELSMTGPLISAGMIALLHVSLSYLSLYTPRFRRIIEDEPIILMKNGVILHDQLRKTKITLESFLMALRLKNASDLSEIDYAILELNGEISIIKKSEYEPVTLHDMNKTVASKGYTSVLIEDGRIIEANVKKVGTLQWLDEQIKKRGYNSAKEIFLMTINEAGTIYVSPKLK